MTPRTVNVICAKAPRKIGCVPAVRYFYGYENLIPVFC